MPSDTPGYDVAAAHRDQLLLRRLRVTRGEHPRGFKLGFTTGDLWPRHNVFVPIWASVWDSTLVFCEGEAAMALGRVCQPRLEPEAVFGFMRMQAPGADMDSVFECLDWVAPGFEVVQAPCPDWKFRAPNAVAEPGCLRICWLRSAAHHRLLGSLQQ